MNKRITELLAQATQESIDGPFANPYVDQKKFAELIIKECVKRLQESLVPEYEIIEGFNEDWNSHTYWAIDTIKNHFGVTDD